ncbi:MAG: Zn-dependent hydrolase [Candidatus Microsaccharimonas sossegonensis]|uniref:Zn-dependent hydrolase n=1 Tax=Candidatus Microsaccharimonas sossegonensis TaxID=2506948 RepID=A0A4Q0AHN3_9BACT|nr:MAG: Zn-dependent hydrolase [Candidatus Microsaccharimonas sossegonensis]
MFEIEYKGANSVSISTKKSVLVTDPKLSLVGLKDVSTKDAVELATEARFALHSENARLNIEGPGEYGVADFDIKGIAARRHLDSEAQPLMSTIYRVEINETRIAIVGNIYEKLSEAQLEDIGLIDILIIPVGGNGYTLDVTGAASVIRSIDPKIVIPVHYADAGITYEVQQDSLETFTKELGAPVEELPKFRLKQGAALPPVLTTVVLTRA